VAECPRNLYQIMATASQFDLNRALQLWLARLGQSPQVKAENLTELESHVRDSVIQLQSKGLSSEESFLVATHRVGSPEKLEPEFAKVNRNPWNMIIHGFVLVFFSIGCWLLWGLLHLPQMMSVSMPGGGLPAFTRFAVDCGFYLAVPPLLAAVYCGYVWILKCKGKSSWMGFFATTMAVLVLLTLPTLIAVLLPVIFFMQNQFVAK
jgi:hypothetical protein